MIQDSLKFVGRGEDSHLLVFEPPAEYLTLGIRAPTCLAIPVIPRKEGFLLAIPENFLQADVVTDALFAEDGSLFGPSRDFVAPLIEEDESGLGTVNVGVEARFLVIDVSHAGLEFLREYDPVTDPSGDHMVFSVDRPEAIPQIETILDRISEWIQQSGGAARLDFYSAREEPTQEVIAPSKPAPKKAAAKKVTAAALAETVSALSSQVQLLAAQQQELMKSHQASFVTPVAGPELGKAAMPSVLPPVSAGMGGTGGLPVPKISKLLGPPPKTKQPVLFGAADASDAVNPVENPESPGGDEMTRAIVQQSQAISALVSHLASGDPIADLSSTSASSQGIGTRGVARRERMQQELATGSSSMFMQVQQQIYKKMNPALPVPRTEQDLLASGTSMCAYLERFGGYKGKNELGMIMWMLGHCMDSAASGDVHKTREFLALTTACVEQASMDGHWGIAYVLSLLEEPPSQLFADRAHPVSALGKPFSPLVPGVWSATALAYLKEVDLLSTKKTEARPQKSPAKAEDPSSTPSPKRRPRFPKKPKGGGETTS